MTVMDEMLADLEKATARLQSLIRDTAGHGTMSWANFMAEARNELTDALWCEGAAEFLEVAQQKNPHLTFKEMLEK